MAASGQLCKPSAYIILRFVYRPSRKVGAQEASRRLQYHSENEGSYSFQVSTPTGGMSLANENQ